MPISNSSIGLIADFTGSRRPVIIDLASSLSWDGVQNEKLQNVSNALGSSFDDTIYGNAAVNFFDGGLGGSDFFSDALDRRFGSDTLSYLLSPRGVIVDMPSGASFDGVFTDRFTGIENVLGSSFSDTIYGNAGGNVIDGGAGADLLIDSFGSEATPDTLSYASSSFGVIADMPSGLSWDGQYNDRFSGFENVFGSAFSDTIYGDAGNNVIDGANGGADTLFGGAGEDTLSYASSRAGVIIDLPSGLTWDGSVNDQVAGFENVTGSAFNDTIYGDAGNNIIDGGAGGADALFGGAGQDTVSYASSLAGVIIDLPSGLSWDGTVNDRLDGFENAFGSAFNETIYGGTGNNVIDGGPSGADLLFGGAGTDTLSYASSTSGVIIDLVVNLTWDGVVNDQISGFENAIGSIYNDTIFGDGGNNVLDGGAAGADVIFGSAGNDTLSYASSLFGAIVDIPAGVSWDGASNDSFSGIENLIGSRLGDKLYGDAGVNTIDGGGGNDSLSGGFGADVFQFTGPGFGSDIISDFGVGGARDKIAFADIPGLTLGSLVFSSLNGGTVISAAEFGGSAIFVAGVAPNSFQQSDFVFL